MTSWWKISDCETKAGRGNLLLDKGTVLLQQRAQPLPAPEMITVLQHIICQQRKTQARASLHTEEDPAAVDLMDPESVHAAQRVCSMS